jgi:hypothetical protein
VLPNLPRRLPNRSNVFSKRYPVRSALSFYTVVLSVVFWHPVNSRITSEKFWDPGQSCDFYRSKLPREKTLEAFERNRIKKTVDRQFTMLMEGELKRV